MIYFIEYSFSFNNFLTKKYIYIYNIHCGSYTQLRCKNKNNIYRGKTRYSKYNTRRSCECYVGIFSLLAYCFVTLAKIKTNVYWLEWTFLVCVLISFMRHPEQKFICKICELSFYKLTGNTKYNILLCFWLKYIYQLLFKEHVFLTV